MSVLRHRPRGARFASFGFGLCVFALIPTEVGYQDIASLLMRQPGVAESWQNSMVASAARSIQVATFSFVRPIGTSIPRRVPLQLASFDSNDGAATRLLRNPLLQHPPRYAASDFPRVDRTLKGDRLALVRPADAPAMISPHDTPAAQQPVAGEKTAAAHVPAPLDPELAEALKAPPLQQYDISLSLEADPLGELDAEKGEATIGAAPKDAFSIKTASLFFGPSSLGETENLESWQPGEAPVLVMPGMSDPDMKTASAPGDPASSGETVAPKGEVNADSQKTRTPAERLGLFDEKARAKQEKCLAEAVYFEARGEAVRGQIAVAQVVMNRVFSGYYPTTVCGVVYQNANRHLACQFTFACDGIPDVVREPDMWDRARRIARATLDGQLWLPEVGKSTHYHAYWVHPSWVHEMKRMYKFGVHTFYRPRAWGDGSDAPSWGSPAETAKIAAQLAEVKP